MIDKFNASQDQYVVKQQVQNWEDIYQKAASAVQAQKGPDLQFAIPDFTTALKPTGAVQPVDDIVEELDGEHKFLPSAVQPYKYEDHTWAVPVFGMVQMLWYRKDLFEKAGLDPEAPPKTWDELRAAAQKLTGDGKYGIGVPSSKHLYTDQELYSFMTTNRGKDLFDAEREGHVRHAAERPDDRLLQAAVEVLAQGQQLLDVGRAAGRAQQRDARDGDREGPVPRAVHEGVRAARPRTSASRRSRWRPAVSAGASTTPTRRC